MIAAPSLLAIVNHFKGTQLLPPSEPRLAPLRSAGLDLADVKGQESAKRAIEIAAAGGHNLLMMAPITRLSLRQIIAKWQLKFARNGVKSAVVLLEKGRAVFQVYPYAKVDYG